MTKAEKFGSVIVLGKVCWPDRETAMRHTEVTTYGKIARWVDERHSESYREWRH